MTTLSPIGARHALRVALGLGFLSAVASRLGIWGAHAGHLGEAFAAFRGYVAELNPWVPRPLLPALAVAVTAAESTLGLALVAGYQVRAASFGAGVLLVVFATAMSLFTGVQSAFDYSVWSAAAGAFLLSAGSPALRAARSTISAPFARRAEAARPR